MSTLRANRRLVCLAAAIALLVCAPAAAQDEEARTGYVQRVDYDADYVVIDDRRYRLHGTRVQPPPEVASESQDHRARRFEAGMIVRYTLAPGNPPAIHEAWAVDR